MCIEKTITERLTIKDEGAFISHLLHKNTALSRLHVYTVR